MLNLTPAGGRSVLEPEDGPPVSRQLPLGSADTPT